MSRTGDNIFKRKDGRWEGRFIKCHQDGKAKYGYVYAKTYRETKLKLQAAIQSNNQPSSKEPVKYSIWLEHWLKLSKLRVKESSFIKYKNSIEKHIKPALGHLLMSEISTSKVETFIDMKLGELSPKSVSELLIIIKDSIRSANAEGDTSPCQLDRLAIKYHPSEMRVLTLDEEKRLISILLHEMDRYKLGILISLFTGIRIGELCALQGKDISINNKIICISKTMQRLQCSEIEYNSKTRITVTEPKSNKSKRIIPIPETIIPFLQQFPTQENEYFLSGNTEHFVEPRVIQNRFKTYLSSINVNDVGFHCLRHTFATRSVELGFDIKTLSEILGHSSVRTTMDRYVHTSSEKKRENMNKLNLYSF